MLRRIACLGLALGWCLLAQTDSAANSVTAVQPKPLRVLFIGNSYTYFNNLPELLRAVAASQKDGPRIETEGSLSGGKSLQWHWENSRALEAIRRGGWDFVVLQEHSLLGRPPAEGALPAIGDPTFVLRLREKVRRRDQGGWRANGALCDVGAGRLPRAAAQAGRCLYAVGAAGKRCDCPRRAGLDDRENRGAGIAASHAGPFTSDDDGIVFECAPVLPVPERTRRGESAGSDRGAGVEPDRALNAGTATVERRPDVVPIRAAGRGGEPLCNGGVSQTGR